jgi:hypothetical protein
MYQCIQFAAHFYENTVGFTVTHSVAIGETQDDTVKNKSACPHPAETAILTLHVPFRLLLHLLNRSELLYNCCHVPQEAWQSVPPNTHE